MKGSDVDLKEIEEMMQAHNLENSARNSRVELTQNRAESVNRKLSACIELENL